MKTVTIQLQKEADIVKHSFSLTLDDCQSDTKVIIENAYESNYANGWLNYKPYISKDGQTWQISESAGSYDNKQFSFIIPAGFKMANWYQPYTATDFNNFVKSRDIENLIETENNIPFIKIGDFNKPTILIMARQHPGETQGSFMLEGIIDELMEIKDKFKKFSFLIIPMANISGVENFNHRYSVEGVDFNRAWNSDNKDIQTLKQIISQIQNKAFCLDLHADEASKKSYIYYGGSNFLPESFYQSLFPKEFMFLKELSRLRRFAKNLIRHKRIVSLAKPDTAKNYFIKNGFDSFTIELVAHTQTPQECYKLGKKLIKNLKKQA